MEQIQVRVGFGEAVKRAFSKCFCFSGRASRSEYWWFVLFHCAVLICIWFLVGLMPDTAYATAGNLETALTTSWVLVGLIPYLSLCCRRLHDIDKSSLCIFVRANPFFGEIRWLIWMCMSSELWANDYGDVPNMVDSEEEQ